MQDPVLHFRSEVLETIGEIQQKCMLQTFLSHLEIKLIDLSIVFFGNCWRCSQPQNGSIWTLSQEIKVRIYYRVVFCKNTPY
jgi:hypothetical protein